MADSTGSTDSPPMLPEDSAGSSVSSQLQDEYDELLKFAVVVPTYDPQSLPRKITDTKGSFAEKTQSTPLTEGQHIYVERQESSDVTSSDSDVLIRDDQPSSTEVREPKTKSNVKPQTNQYLPSEVPESHEKEDSPFPRPENESQERITVYTLDPDVSRMETVLDQWSFDLKRNVLAELSQIKIMIMEQAKNQMNTEKERYEEELQTKGREMENLKELLQTYENSIQRKDEVISNLTRALQRHKEKTEMMRSFCDWRMKHNDMKREAFASNLARRHYHHILQRKAWDGWHSLIQDKWRQRVEKACQSKATEVCMELTNDYEARVKSLNEALEAARVEVDRLHKEREKYEEMMKKAFMRGVCALNLEAMSMFQEGERKEFQESLQNIAEASDSTGTSDRIIDSNAENIEPRTIPQEPVFFNPPSVPPQGRVVTSQAAMTCRASASSQAKSSLSSKHTRPVSSTKTKVISAKVTAKSDVKGHCASMPPGGAMGLAPPMSSVLVERYQPVNKQTIGHAIASKYPKTSEPPTQTNQSTIAFRKIAGQSGSVKLVNPNIKPVKMVE